MTENLSTAKQDALDQAAERLGLGSDGRLQLTHIQEWLVLNYEILTETIGDSEYAELVDGVEARLGPYAARALSDLCTEEIWTWEDFANNSESANELLRIHALAFPTRKLADVLAPHTPARVVVVEADDTTPHLVRAFTEIKCANARGEQFTNEQHGRLGRIVTELRTRGVLD